LSVGRELVNTYWTQLSELAIVVSVVVWLANLHFRLRSLSKQMEQEVKNDLMQANRLEKLIQEKVANVIKDQSLIDASQKEINARTIAVLDKILEDLTYIKTEQAATKTELAFIKNTLINSSKQGD